LLRLPKRQRKRIKIMAGLSTYEKYALVSVGLGGGLEIETAKTVLDLVVELVDNGKLGGRASWGHGSDEHVLALSVVEKEVHRVRENIARENAAEILDETGATRHDLKTHPEPFEEVSAGRKKFEYRRDDRDFRVGDVLLLMCFNPETQKYDGREVSRVITYILRGSEFGVAEGFCVLSLDIPAQPKGD